MRGSPHPPWHPEYQLIMDRYPEYRLIIEMESRILMEKRFKKNNTFVLQYFCSLELSLETFPVGVGGVLTLFVKNIGSGWLYLRINNT